MHVPIERAEARGEEGSGEVIRRRTTNWYAPALEWEHGSGGDERMSRTSVDWLDYDKGTIIKYRARWNRASINKRRRHAARPNGRGRGR